MIGKTVAHYQIIRKLGQGGMGDVFLAQDSVLSRRVALKFMQVGSSADRRKLARFEREAQLLASLNHPNVAVVHGLEGAAGMRFIVMELVEGETLADKIRGGPMPVAEALSVCRQIAAGLEAAHEKGIIHRDLKPANVMVSPDGKAKILDFGLARVYAQGPGIGDVSQAASLTASMSQPGTLLGTAPYMSPEQVTGRTLDKRTDIWAFGCVLYECLTGKRAFPGQSMAEVTAAILEREPAWTALSEEVPAAIRTLLRRCLQQDPERRLRDIGDARLEIDECAAEPADEVQKTRRISGVAMMALALVLAVTGLALWLAFWRTTPAAPAQIVTSIIKLAPGQILDGMRRPQELERPSVAAIAVAGDGSYLVYSAARLGGTGAPARPQLYLRRLDHAEALPIVGTEGGSNPFLSPDDQWVGFWADGKLMKVPIGGGLAKALCDVPRLLGATWGPDGTIAFSLASGLCRVAGDGGIPDTLTVASAERNEFRHLLPAWLPDGQHLVFTIMAHAFDRNPRLALLNLAMGTWQDLLLDAADARFVPTGHLVFLRHGTLMGVRFDVARLKVIGQPTALVDNVAQAFSQHSVYNTAAGQFALSRTGCLLYAEGGVVPDPLHSLVWVDRTGREQMVTAVRKSYFSPRLSPDGERIAYATRGYESRIWVYDLQTDTHNMLTRDGADVWPIWSHDGQHIAFSRAESHGMTMYWKPYDGSAPMKRLTASTHGQFASSCSADGTTIAVVEVLPGLHGYDIGILDLSSTSLAPYLRTPFQNACPEFSPDGTLIAWVSDESGRREVFVQPFRDPIWKRQISSEGGAEPLWARDGQTILYRWQDRYWSVDVLANDPFTATRPRLLFEKPYEIGVPVRCWDISLDSQRFLMVKSEELAPQPLTELTLVLNWHAALDCLVP